MQESDENEPAFVRYMKCVPSLDDVDETLRSACLQWEAADSAEQNSDEENKREDKDAPAAGKWIRAI